MSAYTYILSCADGTLYTGWTNDLERRLREHNTPGSTTKYTRTRQPCTLVYYEEYPDQSAAMHREWEIKNRMSRQEKMALIEGMAGRAGIDNAEGRGYTKEHAETSTKEEKKE